MAAEGIFYVPTLSVYVHHSAKGTPHGRARAAALGKHHVRSLEMALDAGVKVVAGTDEGGWVHGNNAHEISCLVDAGLSPMQALVAATGDAVGCLGFESQTGTIEAGKAADLVLVDGDPLRDVALLEEGNAVKMVKGRDGSRRPRSRWLERPVLDTLESRRSSLRSS